MRVKPGGPKRARSECSPLRLGLAGTCSRYPRVRHDRTRPGVRPGRGALPLGGVVPRWCAWVVGVVDVTSGVGQRVKFSTGSTDLGRPVCTNPCQPV